MAPKIYPLANSKFIFFLKKVYPISNWKVVLGIHEEEFSEQGEFKNYLTQIFEPMPIIVEMDVETEVLFATFGPIVGMLESIPVDQIITLASIKQKPKKINIVEKFQDVQFVKMFFVETFFNVGGNLTTLWCKVCTK